MGPAQTGAAFAAGGDGRGADRFRRSARFAGPVRFPLLALLLAAAVLSGCAETQLAAHIVGVAQPEPPKGHYKVGQPYEVNGVAYRPQEDYAYDETGIASWYGPGFHARLTANGELYDQDALTAAHPTLQLPAMVRVTNLENGRSLVLRVNDRGPFVNGRLIDVSRRAAELLGFQKTGTARVRVQVLADESRQVAAMARYGVPATPVAAAEPASATPAAVTPVALATPAGATVAPGAIVTQEPVAPTSIYVQAGAFSVEENAVRLRDRLGSIAPTRISTATVDGVAFHRVRLGPLSSVEDADRVLDTVIGEGHTDARIIVE